MVVKAFSSIQIHELNVMTLWNNTFRHILTIVGVRAWNLCNFIVIVCRCIIWLISVNSFYRKLCSLFQYRNNFVFRTLMHLTGVQYEEVYSPQRHYDYNLYNSDELFAMQNQQLFKSTYRSIIAVFIICYYLKEKYKLNRYDSHDETLRQWKLETIKNLLIYLLC